MITGMTEEEIRSLEGVVSVTNVKLYKMNFYVASGSTFITVPVSIVAINMTDFTSTFYTPAKEITDLSWSDFTKLRNDSAFMSVSMLEQFYLEVGDYLDIKNATQAPIAHHYVEILDNFELFPAYYFEEDALDYEKMIIMNTECLNVLQGINSRVSKVADDLYIKTKDKEALVDVQETIFNSAGIISKTYLEIKDSLKTPLYNIFIIEMILSLFVASVVLVFSSFTTAIKILEKRRISHDIMKKMGLRISTIVNISSIQSLIAAILPALLIGTGVGLSVILPTLNQLGYGSAPYPLFVRYPVMLMIVLFIGVPLLVYLGLSYSLRREFTKYAPTIME
jgi:hypothetical protein